MDDVKEDGARLAEGNFQITMQLSQSRSLVVSGYLYHGEESAERNARVDSAQDLLDRQFVRCDMVNKQAQREATLQAMEMHRDQLEELRALQGDGAKGKPRLTSQQLEILKRGDESLRTHQKNIALYDSMIAAAKKKLGMEP